MATGFLGAGTHATQITANQVEKERYDELDDMTATVGTAMLGLTVGCARCHDHKYDPIPQGDYYRMLSTFTTAVRSEIDIDFDPEQTRRAKLEFDRRHAPLVEALAEYEAKELPGRLPRPLRAGETIAWPRWLVRDPARARSWTEPLLDALRAAYRVTDPGWAKLSMAVRESRRSEPKPSMTKVMVTSEGLPAVRLHTQGADFFEKTYFLKRGDPNQKQGEATQGFLQVLTRAPEGPEHWQVEPPEGCAHVVSPDGPGATGSPTSTRRRPPAGAGDRQPALAAPLRPRDRRHAQRLRQAGRTPHASRAARLAGGRADPRRLAAQADPQAHHDQRRLHAGGRGRFGARRRRPRQHAALAPVAAPARGRGDPRRDARRRRHARHDDVRPRHARRGPSAPEHLLHRQAQPADPRC